MGFESEQPAELFRFACEGWRAAAVDCCEILGELTAGHDRPIRHEPEEVSRDHGRCRHAGHVSGIEQTDGSDPNGLWCEAHIRDLRRRSYESSQGAVRTESAPFLFE